MHGAPAFANFPAMCEADSSDEDLMRRFCETLDDGVFRSLAERYYDRALRLAESQLANGTTAYDAVQETFIRVVRHCKRYDPEKPFAPWFFTILRHVCADFRRKEARQLGALHRYADRGLPSFGSEAATGRARALLECLDSSDVRLLEWRYGHGLSVAEAAGRLGCSVEAAKKRFQRIIKRLQSYSLAQS